MGRWAPLRGVLLTENGRLTPLTALQLLSSMLWLPPVLKPDQAETKAVPSEEAAAADDRADDGVAATLAMLAAQQARPTRADWVNSCIMFLSDPRKGLPADTRGVTKTNPRCFYRCCSYPFNSSTAVGGPLARCRGATHVCCAVAESKTLLPCHAFLYGVQTGVLPYRGDFQTVIWSEK